MTDTNVGASAVEDVTFTHVNPNATPKAKRAPSVSDADFKMTYIKMAKSGSTNVEIATALGMNPGSLVSRASALRAQLKKLNPPIELPYPKTERGQGGRESTKMSEDALRKFLETLDGTSTVGQ